MAIWELVFFLEKFFWAKPLKYLLALKGFAMNRKKGER
jgi:hypothetical protein